MNTINVFFYLYVNKISDQQSWYSYIVNHWKLEWRLQISISDFLATPKRTGWWQQWCRKDYLSTSDLSGRTSLGESQKVAQGLSSIRSRCVYHFLVMWPLRTSLLYELVLKIGLLLLGEFFLSFVITVIAIGKLIFFVLDFAVDLIFI